MSPVERAAVEISGIRCDRAELHVSETPCCAASDAEHAFWIGAGNGSADDDIPSGGSIGTEAEAVAVRVVLVAPVHCSVAAAAEEAGACERVVADEWTVRAIPEVDASGISFDDEVMSGACEQFVSGVVVKDVVADGDVLHHVPTVLGVERTRG